MSITWQNYFVNSKDSRLTDGHISASDLYKKILSHDGTTAYCSYFDLDESLLKNEFFTGEYDSDGKKLYAYLPRGEKGKPEWYKPNITFTQYEGICRPALDLISFDFDGENPDDALNDVRKFCKWLNVTDIAIFYSGSKGFHIMIPFSYFPLEVNKDLHVQLRDMAKKLKETYPTLDSSIYNYNRKFRVPFTIHEKTSRYKSFVPVEYIHNLTIEAIIDNSQDRLVVDFIADLELERPRNALDVLIDLWEKVKRASYEIEKERAGTIEKPSPFEAYDQKLCIKKLLESRCDDVGRNNACMRIVNDFYRTGKTLAFTQDTVFKWADGNGLPRSEANTIITNIFERGANYNFGCQDEVKSLYCSAKCSIWKKLDPEKRPVTVDQPSNEASLVKDIKNVERLLTSTFKCEFDEIRGEFSGGNILRQGKDDLFYYNDGYWQHMGLDFVDKIQRRLNIMNSLKLNAKSLEAIYKLFIKYVPTVPEGVDMFTPNPTCANFKNGTLHLLETIDGKYYLEFKKHDPRDYITFKIDYDYVPNGKVSSHLLQLLDNVFSDDSDKEDRINAISEMFGASLIPYFPHLFYLYGKAQSGKSSIMLILNQMHSKSGNICSVQPKNFNGFNLSSMVGKLVNLVTDVDTRRPIDDDIVKMIEDRIPFTIARKFQADIRAPLPSLHVFGGNDLLKSFEGYSAAMQRRWTILQFNKTYDGPKSRNFSSKVFNADPQGVVNFAIMGLQRLVESQGYFTEFKSSTAALESWALESDIVAQFLEDAKNNELDVEISFGKEDKIERKVLWDIFSRWQEKNGHRYNDFMKKFVFYKRINAKGYKTRLFEGSNYFSGLGELKPSQVASNNATKGSDII